MSETELYGDPRPRAFAIAYQMLGSVSEAEDVVQEAFLRMHQTLRRNERIASPRAYVATLVTRLAVDQLRSARARRERYVGEWLPEPLVADPTPADRAETADSLSLAFLVLLESLSPAQRAAFLLHGQPGAMAFDAQDRLIAVVGLDIADGQIQTIHSVVNPDKLRHFDRVGDLAALVRTARRHS